MSHDEAIQERDLGYRLPTESEDLRQNGPS